MSRNAAQAQASEASPLERLGVAETLQLAKFALDQAADAVYWINLHGRFVYANDTACHTLGYSLEELRTMSVHDIDALFPNERWPVHWNELRQRRSFVFESCHRAKDGRTFPVEVSVNHVISGDTEYNCAFARDITQRKRADEALRESEERYRSLVENVRLGITLMDQRHRILMINRVHAGMIGRSVEGCVGQECFRVFEKRDVVCPHCPGTRAMATGRAAEVETTGVRDDGSSYAARVQAFPVCGPDGAPVGFIEVVEDISERKQAEAALAESEQRVRTICDSALDAVVMTDATGKTLYWNPAAERMFGYTPDEMLGREVHAILPALRYRDQAFRGFGDFAVSGNGEAIGKIVELTALRKDGSQFPMEMSLAAFRMNGQWCAVAVVRDITERKKAREALERERRTLEHLLRAGDHERQVIAYDIHDGLAQQLAGAIMQLEAFAHLRDAKPKQASDAYQAGMTMLRQGHAEARRLISGVRPPILDEAGVVAAIAHLVNERRNELGPKIQVHSKVSFTRLVPILENAVYRIVQEGLTNACQHSRSERVRIRMLQQGDQLRIEIRDWGVGFDVEVAPGSRFGLEGIRERARLLGGKVRIRSQLGKGTSITVALPVVEREADG